MKAAEDGDVTRLLTLIQEKKIHVDIRGLTWVS